MELHGHGFQTNADNAYTYAVPDRGVGVTDKPQAAASVANKATPFDEIELLHKRSYELLEYTKALRVRLVGPSEEPQAEVAQTGSLSAGAIPAMADLAAAITNNLGDVVRHLMAIDAVTP